MPDTDLISVETGRYVNVQSMIFKFIYERSPLFTEQVLVIPIILVFFGELLIEIYIHCNLRILKTVISQSFESALQQF